MASPAPQPLRKKEEPQGASGATRRPVPDSAVSHLLGAPPGRHLGLIRKTQVDVEVD